MHWIDYAVVAGFLVGLLGLGAFLSKKAGKNTDEFILGGRSLPWWLAGASLLATGLNASTMLQDSRKVRQDGLGGLWFSWRSILTSSIAGVFFQRLWRRAAFVTQMEFYHARYQGRGADVARTFDSVIYGVFVAAMWAAIGLVGMKKVASVLLGLPSEFMLGGMTLNTDLVIVISLVVITLIYSAASGVYGVVWTDMVEAVIALVASYTLAFMVLAKLGGPSGLHEKLTSHTDASTLLSLTPTVGAVFAFYIIFALLEQGGYNPHIQRSLCLKDEREVMYTQLYSMILNHAVKSWPYYICGLAGLFLISDGYLIENFSAGQGADGAAIADYEMVFPALVRQFLPVGLMGLMAAGFLSAFMSSFDTNIHNSTSIFTNDLYKAYLAPGRDEKHYVKASRWYMVFITVLASIVGVMLNDILYLFMFAINVMQSVGMVKLLRFIWWRVNIWGELAAQVCSVIITTLMLTGHMNQLTRFILTELNVEIGNDTLWAMRTFLISGMASTVSIVVVLLTPAEPMDKLVAFYKRVRPFGWWGPVKAEARVDAEASDSLRWLLVLSLSMITATLGILFSAMGLWLAMGKVLLFAAPAGALGLILYFTALKKLYPDHA